MSIKINKWMVYFRCSDNGREGNEIMHADSREEAIRLYRHFFGVENTVVVKAIPVIDKELTSGSR